MKIRFYNAWILTMEEENGQPFEGELWVEEDCITYVGPAFSHEESFDRQIDCQKNLLMPGFKNAHTHSAMTFLRSFADDLSLHDWLYKRVFPMEAKLKNDDMIPLEQLAILEYLTSGITANFDMYFYNPSHAKASVELGYRTVLCGSMNDFVGSIQQTEEEYLKYNEYHDLISYQLGFHAEYTTKRELLEQLAKMSQKYHAPVFAHIAETKQEVIECKERYGKSPFQFLDSIGMFEFGGAGFHGVYMDDEDYRICRDKKIGIVSNPASNLKLASGIADLCRMQQENLTIALGTDGPASNNALDLFREMYLASTLQKLKYEDASVMDANAILKMATVDGARVMGLKDCDTLSAGKQADLILIDLKRPNMQPIHNITKNLVYSGSKENVKMTMIAGKILYENGEFHVGKDVGEIYQKAEMVTRRIESEAEKN